jgi:hypothetical protein
MKFLHAIPSLVLTLSLSSVAVAMDTDITTDAGAEAKVAAPAGSALTDAKAAMPEASSAVDAKMDSSTAAGSSKVSITNSMPHDMVVNADWGQGQSELGMVKSNETMTFDVAAAAGTEVNLIASDSAKTHTSKGTLTLDAKAPANWTIK